MHKWVVIIDNRVIPDTWDTEDEAVKAADALRRHGQDGERLARAVIGQVYVAI